MQEFSYSLFDAFTSESNKSDSDTESDENSFEIESILRSKDVIETDGKKQTVYLIKWKVAVACFDLRYYLISFIFKFIKKSSITAFYLAKPGLQ